ncbi:alpha/beta hydrolase [Nocardioides zeae]|uniref:Alpha/beta hydrolase n=1 Tax=Nocardioides imazamoxiresistens TaxID=3231893 RepID=A0ABU3PVN2_9ACTN|nr:alpha/beta hydrolase [Nocardioides zeae]MDT9593298.1 alpha/beta hydrolase [Nocardioides zeae]
MRPAIDPGLAGFLEQAAAAGAPPITAGSVADARTGNAEFLRTMRTRQEPVRAVEELSVPTRAGDLPARAYLPVDEPVAVVVYLHGGGWVLGDLEGHDQLCRHLAATSGAVVVNVNYRHAPETRFPGPAEDAADAVAWAAATYPYPVVVMGDSAGGNLAASAAVASRDAGVRLDLQVLLYPVLDADLTRESYRRNGDGYLLTAADMDWFWDHYVGDGDRFDPRASVLRVDDLDGLAPAVVLVAGYDPLHDEGIAYADRLAAAGVPCDVLEYPGAIHGFMTLHAVSPLGEQAAEEVAGLVRRRTTAAV